MSPLTAVREYLDRNRERNVEDLCAFLRIPSISAKSDHRDDVRRAAKWVEDRFTSLGFPTEVVETKRHPIILAESPDVPGAPTILVYGHYDVQPTEPEAEWLSGPFEPTIRDGNVYARGATDDKGQMLTHLLSTEAWMKSAGSLPVKLKFVIEGEEEVGSESLYEFMKTSAARLQADVAVISDSSQFAPGHPAITYGLKGIAYFEVRLDGPKQDLHSGTFGGGVTNPANALARMLAALRDERGRVCVPGFYDDVIPLGDRERRQFAELPFQEDRFLRQLGISGVTGEEGYTTLERRWARPTCDINGLTSGYQGEGAKTVLPAWASAKFSFRLVPNQRPERVGAALRTMLENLTPPGIRLTLTVHHGAPGVVVSLDNPFMSAAAKAIEQGFGKAPVYIREGGSIPIVTAFKEQLGIDTLLLGWGQDDDNTHSPNEKFSLADFHRGALTSAFLWSELSKVTPPRHTA
ncbi:MAG TPA: dipeptidase [Pirellulaceae bacterium]